MFVVVILLRLCELFVVSEGAFGYSVCCVVREEKDFLMWVAMNTLVQVSVVSDGSQGKSEGGKLLHRRSNIADRGLPPQWDLSFSENSLLSVYCFIKNFIG